MRSEPPPLVLASGSPRRRGMLEQLGLAHQVQVVDGVEEPWNGSELPAAFAERMAEAKARAVAARKPEALVLAADTVVVLDGQLLGKPRDLADARAMLRRLSGREHVVLTGAALRGPSGAASGVEATAVAFRPLRADEIETYVATGEPLDKAGAYGIQAYGAILVASVRGCYFNVLGFPVTRILSLLQELGWEYRPPGTLRPVSDR